MVANGDVKTLEGANALFAQTKCDGIMSARGILSNPGLYAGHQQTELQVVQDWIDLCESVGDDITFQCFHHHLTFMMDKMLRKKVRVDFNNFTTKQQVLHFLEEHFGIVPRLLTTQSPRPGVTIAAEFSESAFRERLAANKMVESQLRKQQRREAYSSEASKGKFFLDHTNVEEDLSDSDEECSIDCSKLFGV